MEWTERKSRIRRFIRDPEGVIWSDAFLLRLYNDEQTHIQNAASLLEDIQAVRVPPRFETSYQHEWEWEHAHPSTGYVYQCFNVYDQANLVFTYWWETELISGASSDTSDSGSHFTHPWEAFITTTSDTPPVWCPKKFQKILGVYWDKKPLDPTTKKELTSTDRTWRTRSGKPQKYRRLDALENFIAIYPTPSSVVWDDDDGEGVLIGREDDTISGSGAIYDVSGSLADGDGIARDIINADDNLLIAYRKAPSDITSGSDEGDMPQYLCKYIEHAVLERAFQANTDGRAESLENYWALRREIGERAIEIFKSKRRVDRDYCLKTKGAPDRISRRAPRLPDEYPAVW